MPILLEGWMVSLNHTFDDLLYFLLQWKQHVLLHLHYFLILTTLSALGCPETHNWVDQVTTILHILPSLLAHTQHSFDNILHQLRNILLYLSNRLMTKLTDTTTQRNNDMNTVNKMSLFLNQSPKTISPQHLEKPEINK